MASGRTHARDSLAVAAVSGIALGLTVGVEAGAACAVGALLGIPVGPDLDVDALDRNEWRIVKYTLGVGLLWVWFWLYYGWGFRHRGYSHQPVIGTATRVLYAALMISVILTVLGRAGLTDLTPITLFDRLIALVGQRAVVFAFCGLALSDLVHWLHDQVPRRRPARRRRRPPECPLARPGRAPR